MANRIVINSLRKVVADLISQKKAAIEKFDTQIQEINDAITELGYSVEQEDFETDILYDDTNPDYIKGSQEEI